MLTPRRFLPSISSLLALEAVDRLGSATAAAAELSLTHSAVSRQLKVLEGQLGVQLVARDGGGLRLNQAAREYCQAVRSYLNDLSRASLKLKVNPAGGSLNLAVLPTFGMHWLIPRLGDFTARHPDITVNLSTRLQPFDFGRDGFDAALHFGMEDWQGVAYLPLADEEVLAVSAPGLLPTPPTRPEDLLGAPLLHIDNRPRAWEEWFEAHGCRTEGLHGMLFDQYNMMAEAAAHGAGIALLPRYLADREIAQGRLVRAFGEPIRAAGRYYLVWPSATPRRASLESFIRWASDLAGQEVGRASR